MLLELRESTESPTPHPKHMQTMRFLSVRLLLLQTVCLTRNALRSRALHEDSRLHSPCQGGQVVSFIPRFAIFVVIGVQAQCPVGHQQAQNIIAMFYALRNEIQQEMEETGFDRRIIDTSPFFSRTPYLAFGIVCVCP